MDRLSRSQLAAYAIGALAIVVIGVRYLQAARPGRQAAKPVPVRVTGAPGTARGVSAVAVVQVVGAVRRPGLYRLHAGERIDDAVREAGGATPAADLAGVNLAAKLEDGQQVIVPPRAAVAEPGAAQGGGGAAGSPGGPVNLNTATPEQLDGLDGVGPATAQKIVAYRKQHGGFRSVSELDQVPGIGPKKLAALRAQLRV